MQRALILFILLLVVVGGGVYAYEKLFTTKPKTQVATPAPTKPTTPALTIEQQTGNVTEPVGVRYTVPNSTVGVAGDTSDVNVTVSSMQILGINKAAAQVIFVVSVDGGNMKWVDKGFLLYRQDGQQYTSSSVTPGVITGTAHSYKILFQNIPSSDLLNNTINLLIRAPYSQEYVERITVPDRARPVKGATTTTETPTTTTPAKTPTKTVVKKTPAKTTKKSVTKKVATKK